MLVLELWSSSGIAFEAIPREIVSKLGIYTMAAAMITNSALQALHYALWYPYNDRRNVCQICFRALAVASPILRPFVDSSRRYNITRVRVFKKYILWVTDNYSNSCHSVWKVL